MITRAAAAMTVVLVAAACGSASTHAKSRVGGGACIAEIRFDGRTYYGNTVHRRLHVGRRIGRGRIPACQDTSGGEKLHATSVPLASVTGVRVSVAVIRVDDLGVIYIRRGVCVGYRSERRYFACLARAR